VSKLSIWLIGFICLLATTFTCDYFVHDGKPQASCVFIITGIWSLSLAARLRWCTCEECKKTWAVTPDKGGGE